ncbi:MAG TPA: right-handed parallel beta-helix repeat-containing protein [Candidatus Binatia bacterium]|nr:right-handed parallel beta-helix repeat-containing protein [Candidatus Binatia bacterium]
MTDRFRSHAFRLALSTLVLAFSAGAAHAVTWSVPGDMSNNCTVVTPSCDTIAAAIAASSSGDTIEIGAGTFNENNLVVDKSLTIDGAGIDDTTINAAGGNGFLISASNVTISDLTVSGAVDGTKIQPAAMSAVSNTSFNSVRFSGSTSDGIELSIEDINNTTVSFSEFVDGVNGIRMASNSTVDGLTVTESLFEDNTGLGIYQANDGATSTLTDLSVTDSTFTRNGNDAGDSAIYAEEITNSLIEGNTFTDNFRGILLFKFFNTSGVDLSNVTIRGNTFTGTANQSVEVIQQAGDGIDEPIVIEDNEITQDVGDFVTATFIGAIDIRLLASLSHGGVTIRDNTVTFSGSFGPTQAAHAILLRGDGPLTITGNILLGGGIDGAGSAPPSSGIYLRATDATFGTTPADTIIDVSCNRIEGWENGVSIWNATGAALGGLASDTILSINDNTIANNSNAGVANGASPEVDAEDNYWGCETGPGTAGCDTVVGAVDFTPFLTEPAACVACLFDSECDDGLVCNGVESCDLDTNMCEAGTQLDCDDENQCTDNDCHEPGGCMNTPLSNGTGCSDDVTCSIADTCQAGVCDGGGTDLDMSGVCDEDEVTGDTLNVLRASLKAQKPGQANGKAGAKATFEDDPEFTAAGGVTVTIEDSTGTGGTKSFSAAECVTKGEKVKCKAVDKSGVVSFKPNKNIPGSIDMKAKLKNLAIDGPFIEPLTVTLTYGVLTTKSGSISTCKSKPTSIKCK